MAADGIDSLALMERASAAFTKVFIEYFPDKNLPILVACGNGNNGGDGLAVARMLYEADYVVLVMDAGNERRSADNATNLARVRELQIPVVDVSDGIPPEFPADGTILIDALFGTGLSRPVTGPLAKLIEAINAAPTTRVALDLPSGLPADGTPSGAIIHADYTFCLGYPKFALFAPANTPYLGKWELLPFELNDDFVNALNAEAEVITAENVQPLVKIRHANDHKGTFGHALLVAGAFGTMGAAVIAGRAVLRAGAGLLTCHVPRSGYEIMQISFPEAMCQVDAHRYHTTKVGPTDRYTTIGVGPGLGQAELTAEALRDLLASYDRPMVIDADALNLISKHPEFWELIPANSILTPHPKEFERLFGPTDNDQARTQVQREASKSKRVIIVLKTGFTCITTPSGHRFYNTTGNPGMGTAGTGDALTGVLTGLLAQGYAPEVAARLGVYLHGLAGDIAAERLGPEFLLAEDVVDNLGRAYRQLRDIGRSAG